ncbi:hypothetical protein BWQ96_00867 [Gracilariopsis chorda]|uniref:Uncharacterized protein n=1 Tax=Gracilariopsis chorda TaxID=448386 RepID=A0A2V3J4Q9_9FLOR|nr:hypothetical protein BWQ96_00867 [Gracilariopsis chorda]|eukprot:PXF49293.1 hypothetical protein BWQ96_00867 [Gracilariopsis chorda]
MVAMNVGSNITLSAISDGDSWINIVLAICVGAVVTILEVVAYETAFRGAYRTSSKLRMRYVWMCVANVLLFSVYTFIGATLFNGWAGGIEVARQDGAAMAGDCGGEWMELFVVCEYV